jgi:phosphohistidine phosphatase
VVVGHQPTLGLTAAYLLAGVMQPWPVRKGALWWIKRREREGQVEILLHASLSSEHV